MKKGLMKSQPLPFTPAYGAYKFHAPAVSDPHLESGWKSVVGLFFKNSQRVKAVGCFRGRAPSLMFDGILNATLSEEKVCTNGVTP